jgi:uncharacterized integral membrane protein
MGGARGPDDQRVRAARRPEEGRRFMGFSFWFILIVVIGGAILAIQNWAASPVGIKFLFWNFEISLDYALFGSVAAGILIMLVLWIPRAVKTSSRTKKLRKEVERLEKEAESRKPKEN